MAAELDPARPGPSAPLEGFLVTLLGHDADRTVGFEDDKLSVLDALESVLPQRGLKIVLVEILGPCRRVEPGAVAGDDRRGRLEQPAG